MLYLDDIKAEFNSQGFSSKHMGISPQKDKAVLFMQSAKKTKDVRCSECGSEVYLHGDAQTHLTDMTGFICNLNTNVMFWVQRD